MSQYNNKEKFSRKATSLYSIGGWCKVMLQASTLQFSIWENVMHGSLNLG